MRWMLCTVLWAAGCTGAVDRAAVRVFAASSLTEPFKALETQFEQANPGVDVQLTFAGSQVLRLQIEQGAPADVFASADVEHAAALATAGLLESPRPFASTRLTVIAPRDDASLVTFDDLVQTRRLVVGAPTVPVGRYARKMLERAREARGDAFADAVEAAVVSEESNVRLVRTKVELGEADAAVVYATEVSERVRAVPIPEAMNVSVQAMVGRCTRGEGSPHADAFIQALRSPVGAAALRDAGFKVGSP